jgi:hypothetical protein
MDFIVKTGNGHIFLEQCNKQLTVAHSKHGMGVEVFLRQWEQWLTRKIGSSTAAYGSSRKMTSPIKKIIFKTFTE